MCSTLLFYRGAARATSTTEVIRDAASEAPLGRGLRFGAGSGFFRIRWLRWREWVAVWWSRQRLDAQRQRQLRWGLLLGRHRGHTPMRRHHGMAVRRRHLVPELVADDACRQGLRPRRAEPSL